MNTERYAVDVFWSEEDQGYIAEVPDLPGCSAFGTSRDEAMAAVRDSIVSAIEALEAAGNPIPPPSARVPTVLPSGKVLVRMGRDLHARLIAGARLDGTSLNTHIITLLSAASAQRTTPASATAVQSKSTNLFYVLGSSGSFTDFSSVRVAKSCIPAKSWPERSYWASQCASALVSEQSDSPCASLEAQPYGEEWIVTTDAEVFGSGRRSLEGSPVRSS